MKKIILIFAVLLIGIAANAQLSIRVVNQRVEWNEAGKENQSGSIYTLLFHIQPILPQDMSVAVIKIGQYVYNYAPTNVSINGVACTSFNDLVSKVSAISVAGGSGVPVGGATSVLQQTQVDSVAASNTLLRGVAKETTLTTLNTKFTAGTVVPTVGSSAINVRQVPSVAVFGTVVPTVTAYTTNANTVATTNTVQLIIENMSTTTAATFTYGGQTFNLGFKGNGSHPSNYVFNANYDVASQKYSPLAVLVVNAVGSSVFVTRNFAQ